MKQFARVSLIINLLLCLAGNAYAAALDSIAVVVNDTVITQRQLAEQVALYRQQLQFAHAPLPAPAVLRQRALDHMIDNQLQLQLAKKNNIDADAARVNAAITRIAQQNGMSLAELKTKVAEQGMSYSHYVAEIQHQMIVSDLQQQEVGPQIIISEQDITDFLRAHGTQFLRAAATPAATAPALYHAIDILIPFASNTSSQATAVALQTARTTLAQLRQGKTLSVQSSDLGWRQLKDLPDLLAPIIKTLQPGTISEPILAPNGYHLVQLVSLRDGAEANSAAANASVATHVYHILIKSTPLTPDADIKLRLLRLREAILNGASFAQMAKTNSQDPGSALQGGDLGWMQAGMLDPTFEKVMNSLRIGEISLPFKSDFGWHIVQVVARKNIAQDKNLLRNQVRAILYQRKFNEALQTWLQQLRSQSYVQIMPQ